MTRLKNQVGFYIDGFNLYHAIDRTRQHHLKWLNPIEFAKTYLRNSEEVGVVRYFTALADREPDKRQRHELLIKAWRSLGVEVHESHFKQRTRFCEADQKYCEFREEKQTDVGIAVAMLADAFSGRVSRIVLVTADTDQIPAIQFLRQQFPQIELTLAIPPGRKNEARDLGALFIKPKEIGLPRLANCSLPAAIDCQNGAKILRPDRYAPPPTGILLAR